MPEILGVKVDNITRAQAIARVGEMLRDGKQHIITTPNPEFLVAARRDAEFRAILNRADLALPDGAGLMWAARVLGTPLRERIAGSDFVWDIAALAAAQGYTIYLLGGRGAVAKEAAEKLKIKNVKLKITGAEEGPMIYHQTLRHPEELCNEGSRAHARDHTSVRDYSVALRLPQNDSEGELIQRIKKAAPDILLVAFGQVKQEKWIAAHLSELPSVKIAIGVGGAFDFIAGRVRRAPRAFRVLGLEWLWRLILQPWRLPRIWRAVIVFPTLVAAQYLTKGRK